MHMPLAAGIAQGIQHKHRDINIELFTIDRYAKITAVHGAGGRAQAGATGVFKALAGLQQGLVADHAQTFDFFVQAIGIIDVPGPRDDLGADVPGVVYGHCVREREQTFVWAGLVGQVMWCDFHGESVGWHEVGGIWSNEWQEPILTP